MAKSIEELTMSQVADFFIGGQKIYPRLELVICACKFFVKSKGRDHLAQLFFKKIITSDCANPKSFLSIALKGVENEQERRQTAGEIVEYAYCCLNMFIDILQVEIRWAVKAIDGNPPYPGFLTGAEEKKYALLNGREL